MGAITAIGGELIKSMLNGAKIGLVLFGLWVIYKAVTYFRR